MKVAMPRKKGAKRVPKERCRTIYEMSSIGARNKDIALLYSMSRSTVNSIVSRMKKTYTRIGFKKMGRRRKLSDRGMRPLQRYILEHCFEPLYVITGRFNEATNLDLSVITIRRYIRKMHVSSYIAIQKPFLSKKYWTTYSMGVDAQGL